MADNTGTPLTESGLPPRLKELAARYLDASPGDVAVTKLAGDASTRRYFRVQSASAGNPRSGLESVIVSLYPSPFDESESARGRLDRLAGADPAARLTFANDPCAHIEVTDLFLQAGLRVPRVISVWGGEGALLVEDVGDARLQDWVSSRPPDEYCKAYRHALDLVVRIQESTGRCGPDSICTALAFDEAKLRWELDFFFKSYFIHYLGTERGPAPVGRIREDFDAICRELSSMPRVLVHRDYHARNLMMLNGEMYIIDHQDARLGPETYDVVSLLRDPYTRLDIASADGLMEYFLEAKAASSAPLADPASWARAFHLMAVQRTLKAAGTYAYQSAVVNNPVYLPYISPAIGSALASIAFLDRFNHLRSVLEERMN